MNIFSQDQAYAFEQFKQGQNIFVTGPGGTGKTFLIKSMVENMKFNGKKFQVCAMTGCAAVLLQNGARTLHSWSGMGLANGPVCDIIKKILKNKNAVQRWMTADILIVDEVSMMSKKIFELVESLARHLKKRDQPFGGMQIVFTGDFFQLPPVGNRDEEDTQEFCFQSPKWSKVFLEENHVELSTIFRQKNDEQYKRILNQIRIGELDEEGIKILQACVGRELPQNTEDVPTKIYAIRTKTDFVNTNMYNKIKTPEYTYTYETKTNLDIYLETGELIQQKNFLLMQYCNNASQEMIDNEVHKLLNASNKPQTLKLKVGAKVICLHNVDLPRDICNGSQGVVTRFSNNLPVVKYQNGVEMTMEPVWTQSEELPCVAVSQIPLCLAWALTIHKMQGATLGTAEMDLGNSVFEYGQTYVALSRIQTMNGLYLSAFEPGKIKANPIVKQFYKKIKTFERKPFVMVPELKPVEPYIPKSSSDEHDIPIAGTLDKSERDKSQRDNIKKIKISFAK
jgi:ATP-dependent DNA helicase PIF1